MAVAAGIAHFALGTDTAGSGRVPAAFGNVVGLKPTVGSVSARGVVPACRSLDTVSVFARTVDEALSVLRVIAAFDEADPYSRRAPFPHLRRGTTPANARIAGIVPEGAVAVPYARAASLLSAEAVDISEFLAVAQLLYDGPWVAERTAALREVVEGRPEILHPVTRSILENGLTRRTVDAFPAFHQLAHARRSAERLFARYDALLLPTTLPCPTLAEVEADPVGINARLGTWTNFVNLCDLAAIAVPAGMGEDGLPFGVTLVGPAWSEGRLAPLADRLHRALNATWGASGEALPPSAPPDPVQADETALFCIGAHMAGLPLNGQIVALGGRFVRVARHGPCLQAARAGQPPRFISGDAGWRGRGRGLGAAAAAIGALLAQVPAPLGFGTVELEDGPCLGFLAEPAGCADAPDITHLGGWRAWLAERRYGFHMMLRRRRIPRVVAHPLAVHHAGSRERQDEAPVADDERALPARLCRHLGAEQRGAGDHLVR